jgi:hypothetical protein
MWQAQTAEGKKTAFFLLHVQMDAPGKQACLSASQHPS